MYYLDFLSDSPKIFIFGKDTYKTNFGGIIFLIYIIVMIIISLIYLLDYAANETYSFEALTLHNKTSDENETNKMLADEKFNPFLDISIKFKDIDKFAVHHFGYNGLLLEDLPEYNYRERFVDSGFYIYYKCGSDKECYSFRSYWDQNHGLRIGDINFNYQGYKIDHYNETPIYEDNSGNFTETIGLDLCQYQYEIFVYIWEMVKYKDQKSLFDLITKRKTEFIFGRINGYNKPLKDIIASGDYTEQVLNFRSDSKEGSYYYLPLFVITFGVNYNDYFLYKKKIVSFLDVLAKVGALFSTVKFFFSLGFSFYLKNVYNYKMVENILNPPKKETKKIELHHYKINNITSINDIDNNSPLIEEQENTNSNNDININNNNNDVNKNENNENEKSSIIFTNIEDIDIKELNLNNRYIENEGLKDLVQIKFKELSNYQN